MKPGRQIWQNLLRKPMAKKRAVLPMMMIWGHINGKMLRFAERTLYLDPSENCWKCYSKINWAQHHEWRRTIRSAGRFYVGQNIIVTYPRSTLIFLDFRSRRIPRGSSAEFLTTWPAHLTTPKLSDLYGMSQSPASLTHFTRSEFTSALCFQTLVIYKTAEC
jgi:hypothetical protein